MNFNKESKGFWSVQAWVLGLVLFVAQTVQGQVLGGRRFSSAATTESIFRGQIPRNMKSWISK